MKSSEKSQFSREFLKKVSDQFPDDFLTVDPEELRTFGKDWTRIYEPNPLAVVFPRTTDEVSRFLRLCSQYQVEVVPSGGRTGLAAGAVAKQGEVVLSLQRMREIGTVDPLSLTVRVQAGAVTQAVHEKCAPLGLTWPVDFASKGSSHVGGNIATNAGGVKVIRYGLTRNWVLGLQVVTMDGAILELNGALEKNNTGIDLRQLFIGSEGVLGVITEATLKLTRLAEDLDVFFFGVESFAAVLRLFQEVRRGPFQISAFECLSDSCLQSVRELRKVSSPFQTAYPVYVLLELERPHATSREAVEPWLNAIFENHLVLDGTWAQSSREAKELWILREGISESLSARGFVHKNDIALPIANLGPFIEEFNHIFGSLHPDLRVYLFGHIGDGNLHVNTLMPADWAREKFTENCKKADLDLFSLVQKYQGSVSAEHGIGLLKKDALHFSRSPAEVNWMRLIKKAFDPQGLLNPRKIFD
jgi:FAD/FMN-containing dehydrogenase